MSSEEEQNMGHGRGRAHVCLPPHTLPRRSPPPGRQHCGGGEINDRPEWPHLLVVAGGCERGAGDDGGRSVPYPSRLRRLRLRRDLLEQKIVLRINDAELPTLAADGAGNAHGFV